MKSDQNLFDLNINNSNEVEKNSKFSNIDSNLTNLNQITTDEKKEPIETPNIRAEFKQDSVF